MSALHVKYRPTSLDEVVGHPKIVEQLRKAVAAKRAQTFLFTGPAGTGKTTLARILARGFADDQGTIVNFEEIDAAANSGVDAMRAIAQRAQFKAIGPSPVKAIVVDECHRLSSAAWTALLKPIEEPPPHVYWLFCSTEPDKIPKTIQTRCFKVALTAVSEDALAALLERVLKQEGLSLDLDILEAVIEGAAGSPRQALVNLESCLHCSSVDEARLLIKTNSAGKGVSDLCQFLMKPAGGWQKAITLVKSIPESDPEGIRLNVVNYLGVVLLNTKSVQKAQHLLFLIECFAGPYNPSEKIAPLLRSIGIAVGLANG